MAQHGRFCCGVFGSHQSTQGAVSRRYLVIKSRSSVRDNGSVLRTREANRVSGLADPKTILQEIQRLKAQKARLRQQLAEREQQLQRQEQVEGDWPEEEHSDSFFGKDDFGEECSTKLLPRLKQCREL
jgi:hypothetical protein